MMEMQTVISGICGFYPDEALPEHLAETVHQAPASLVEDLKQVLGRSPQFFSFLEFASVLAEALVADDYDQASLKIRTLTVDEALGRCRERVAPLGLSISSATSSTDELISLLTQSQLSLYEALGKKPSKRREAVVRNEAELTVRILSGGERNQRFWMIMDRIYYQYWQPFRSEQLDKMQLMESNVRRILEKGPLTTESLEWLPAHNPLRRQEDLLTSAQKLGLKVFFWSEPIGLPDTWFVTPEVLGITFTKSGEIKESFRHFAEDISNRVSALSDPTRLAILRLIREFGMYNTEIAAFLDLARPTVSKHVKLLREAGLITSSQEGGKARHDICEQAVIELFEDLKKFLNVSR